jgi:hypothetical protein
MSSTGPVLLVSVAVELASVEVELVSAPVAESEVASTPSLLIEVDPTSEKTPALPELSPQAVCVHGNAQARKRVGRRNLER